VNLEGQTRKDSGKRLLGRPKQRESSKNDREIGFVDINCI
jgi:hypothetical protein